jgi:hypothetical protein
MKRLPVREIIPGTAGHAQKTVLPENQSAAIRVPRNGSFEPPAAAKHELFPVLALLFPLPVFSPSFYLGGILPNAAFLSWYQCDITILTQHSLF